MARINDGFIKGLVGNLVFYQRGDQQFVRTNVARKKRKKETNPRNAAFTIVSASASPMVTYLKPMLALPLTQKVYNDIRGWILPLYQVYGAGDWPLTERNMCQLNPLLDLRDYLQVPVTVADNGGGNISVSIPALHPRLQVKAPLRTQQVLVKVMAIATTFNQYRSVVFSAADQYVFDYSNSMVPAREWVLVTGAPSGNIAMVIVAVEYAINTTGRYSREIVHLPAAAIAVGRLE